MKTILIIMALMLVSCGDLPGGGGYDPELWECEAIYDYGCAAQVATQIMATQTIPDPNFAICFGAEQYYCLLKTDNPYPREEPCASGQCCYDGTCIVAMFYFNEPEYIEDVPDVVE